MSKAIVIHGVEYPSYKKAATALNMKYSTLIARIRDGWTSDELGCDPWEKTHGYRYHKPITIENTTYTSRREAAKAFGIRENTFYVRCERGWTEEDFIRGYKKRKRKGENHNITNR